MPKPVIDPNKSYTFSDYFELNPPLDDLLAYFGYSRQVQSAILPHSQHDLSYFAHLRSQLETHLAIVDLNSEAARREVLVAPILFHVGAYLKTRVQIEYSLHVNKQLKGKIDYYIQRQHNFLVIEAKNDDLGRGFTQLAVELIALDKWREPDDKLLYGSISIGDVWRFAILDRLTKVITQDINSYSVPTDLEELLRILIAILEGEGNNEHTLP